MDYRSHASPHAVYLSLMIYSQCASAKRDYRQVMAEDDTATHAEDELVHNGYENDEDVGHYVDMTSRHNACYVTAEQIGEDGHDENIYEDVDCIRCKVSSTITNTIR